MIVLMQFGASEDQIQGVCTAIRTAGLEPLILPGESTAIGIPSAIPADLRDELQGMLSSLDGVSRVTPVSKGYKRASREWKKDSTVLDLNGVKVGSGHFTVMAGPCSVESAEQFETSAQVVSQAGVKVIRGGAFKPRSSPYAFQGLAKEGLEIMRSTAQRHGLITVSEVMSPDMVGLLAEYVDILQIGARSMQNFPLLIEAGKSMKPIFLKRGPAATLDEFLLAAEYVLNQNNERVILCERGVVPLDRTHVRNTLDLNAVPVLKETTHLPVMVDPSHGIGVARFVPAMALASMAAGADGVMVEMHPDPKTALSDGAQSLNPEAFVALMGRLRGLSSFFGVSM